jgi:hypothetical protein
MPSLFKAVTTTEGLQALVSGSILLRATSSQYAEFEFGTVALPQITNHVALSTYLLIANCLAWISSQLILVIHSAAKCQPEYPHSDPSSPTHPPNASLDILIATYSATPAAVFKISSTLFLAFLGSLFTACQISPCLGSASATLDSTSCFFSSVPCCSRNL